jgi:cyanophycinase
MTDCEPPRLGLSFNAVIDRRSTASLPFAALALLAALSAGLQPTRAATHAVPALGPLVIVGGGLAVDDESIYQAILGLRLGGRPICVIPTASADPGPVAKTAVGRFERYGGAGSAVVVKLKPGRADRSKIATTLEDCGGFFFTDGDPSILVDTLREDGRTTLGEQAILRVNRRGGVIAAVGRCAAMMSDPMIAEEGTSEDALTHGVSLVRNDPGPWIRGGMGFFRAGLIDPHHVEQGRTGRLIVALAAMDGMTRGFGVDDGTALVIDEAEARVIGSSQVVVLEKLETGTGARRLDGAQFRVLLLANGDAYDLSAGTAFVDGRKDTLRLPDVRPVAPKGPWVERGLPLYIVDLAVSSETEGAFESKGYRFRLTKEPEFDARAWEVPDGRNLPHGFTAGWFRLEISALPTP